ncbi:MULTISPECIES: type IV pilus secretin PilQ [unclassified Polaromonas]|uniref:type IV pilus secretin PilQ n=1 Tax=unclassified Polaromonas TaxID=2638319 RepID=UPI000F09843D|nr:MULTISPECIES: type IV pilus secretin PilQ [unclassified Polaromonas]AYQ28362.1 type IV pilus secretin PilQ [Polaromonas sp. SP1]QGJ20517.1 type IV pilus secretin PilQ [Polaromonas sp. Pch-P]
MNKQTWAFEAEGTGGGLKRLLERVLRGASLGVAVLVASLPMAANAENSIQSVSGSVQGGTEIIRIDLAEPLATVPTGFSIQAPARIALDFPGVSNAMGRSSVELNVGNLRSANVVQAGERTRVVLNLKAPSTYKAEIQGKTLLITLDASASVASPTAPVQVFAESRNRDVLPLKDIDFRRGNDSSGRIVVGLSNNEVGVDIRQQGQTLVVEFLKTALPEGLRRRLDVADFGTPVQTVTTFQTGDKVRMVVEPKGSWEHSAYQSDNQFVLEVRQQKVDPTKLTQGPGYNGEKLSLNFQNIEIRSLLQVIADFTNFNIVTSDSVTGSVTLRLKDVPWDQALDIILQSKGLGMRKNGNVLVIAPKDELAAKDKLDLESRNAIQSLEAVRTQSFQINYAKAADIATQITAGGSGPTSARILSNRGSVIAESRTNQLFVTDIPSKLEQVQDLITKLDVAVRQVLIEARIVEASDSFGRSLGARLGGQPFNQNTNSSFGGTYSATTAGTTAGQFLSLPAVGQNGFAAATFAVSLYNAAKTRFLNLEISASEADGKTKIVSSPRVVTADQVKALIEQGTELPYQQATSSGATSIAFRKANLKLEVTPQITPEGNIILQVDVNKDSVGRETSNGFAIDTKHIQTQVLVENGGTVVIGGIFEQNDRDNVTKVPFLGDLPGVGNLFKQTTRSATKSELLVFITPKMLTNGSALR